MKLVMEKGIGEIIEKKSRFIAHVLNVETEEQAQDYINKLKKKYWDARHNCYAYVIGDKGEIKKFSDDGEPSGTAGKPILDLIESRELTNCLVVVTRYFGGILLGTGGLVRAYQGATIEGLNNSVLGELIDGITGEVDFDYSNLSKIQYICENFEIEIQEIEYTEKVHMKLVIENSKFDDFVQKLQNEFSGDVNIVNKCKQKICKKI